MTHPIKYYDLTLTSTDTTLIFRLSRFIHNSKSLLFEHLSFEINQTPYITTDSYIYNNKTISQRLQQILYKIPILSYAAQT